jgi:transcriptional regulator with XRE-family HTH domain
MTPAQRIRLARRHGGMSQSELARAVGVQRSAVSHWEAANAKSPNASHLREIAVATTISYEWLATGRGAMALSREQVLDSIPAADALLVEEPIELRLVRAFRDIPMASRVALVEIAEQLAVQRIGRGRREQVVTAMPSRRGHGRLSRRLPRGSGAALPD